MAGTLISQLPIATTVVPTDVVLIDQIDSVTGKLTTKQVPVDLLSSGTPNPTFNSINVTGPMNVGGNSVIQGSLGVTGPVTIQGSLGVTGPITGTSIGLSGAIDSLSGTFGSMSVTGPLSVTGPANLYDGLTVVGPVVINGKTYSSIVNTYSGTATIDFGTGSTRPDQATVVVTGQTAILADTSVDVWIQQDSTTNNAADAHQIANILTSLTVGAVVAGTGFTIYAFSPDRDVFGQFKIRWQYSV
jgi:hypothetical protein